MTSQLANGIQIEYDTFGDDTSPPVLLIMGLGAVSYTHLDVYKRQVYTQIWVSNDGSILWSWNPDNSGLVRYSEDGGRNWQSISTPRSQPPSSLSVLSLDPVGAHGAIAIFPKGVEYSTSNGRTWFRVASIRKGSVKVTSNSWHR